MENLDGAIIVTAVPQMAQSFPKQLPLPAADLERAVVVRVLDKLASDGRAAMASRTAAYGRACYHWATKRSALHGNPTRSRSARRSTPGART